MNLLINVKGKPFRGFFFRAQYTFFAHEMDIVDMIAPTLARQNLPAILKARVRHAFKTPEISEASSHNVGECS